MLNPTDHENLVKSSQTANLLVQDLRELIKCDNPLLGELAIEILKQAVQIEKRLKRIESATRDRKKKMFDVVFVLFQAYLFLKNIPLLILLKPALSMSEKLLK